MPGLGFLTMAPRLIHSFDPRAMGSMTCAVHCYGLQALLIAVVGSVAVRGAWHLRGLARLRALAVAPCGRLRRLGEELEIPIRLLPTDRLVLGVAGLWSPCVIASGGAVDRLSNAELRAALLHERAHLRRRETLWTAAAAFLNRCTPVAVPAAFDAYCRAREFQADQEAARHTDPLMLASALVAFATAEASRGMMAGFGGHRSIRPRIERLVHGVSPSATLADGWAAIGLLACAAAAAALPAIVSAFARCVR
jgi:hypothetical protein